MKKINLLLALFTVTLFYSCSDSEDIPLDGDLIGVWIGQDVDYTGKSTTTAQGQSLETTFIGEAYDVNYTLTFSENPNEVVSNGSFSIELTATVLGQTQVENVEDLEFLESGSWSRMGNELTIINNGEASTATILELSETTLKLGISETENLEDQGVSVEATVDIVMTYIRG